MPLRKYWKFIGILAVCAVLSMIYGIQIVQPNLRTTVGGYRKSGGVGNIHNPNNNALTSRSINSVNDPNLLANLVKANSADHDDLKTGPNDVNVRKLLPPPASELNSLVDNHDIRNNKIDQTLGNIRRQQQQQKKPLQIFQSKNERKRKERIFKQLSNREQSENNNKNNNNANNDKVGPQKRCPSTQGVGGVFIVYTNTSQYVDAINALWCYTISRGYKFFAVNPYTDPKVVKACDGVLDVMYRKHCAAAYYLKKVDWLLVTDGDTSVINPDHCFEEYLDPQAELIFYERFFSGEVMSGSYMVRNTKAARKFLRQWAEIEKIQPPLPHFFSSDNGAIHLKIIETLYPNRKLLHDYCVSLVYLSVWPNWEPGYGAFLRCAKNAMLDFDLADLNYTSEPVPTVRMKMISRAQAWCRDGGITMYRYYPGDFMSHNIKDQEPFDPEWVKGLSPPWGDHIPKECQNPDWKPVLMKDREFLVTEEQMKREHAGAGLAFLENRKLKPLFADDDLFDCWPHCDDVFSTIKPRKPPQSSRPELPGGF